MKQARLHLTKHLGRCAAVVVLCWAAVFVAGCTLTGDNITGLSLSKGGPTTCVKQCNDTFKGEYEKERKLHQQNVEACQQLPQPDKGDCLVAEDARHTAKMDELGAAKIECQNDCHRQGGGSAG